MQTFVAVVKQGSFTAAARHLGIQKTRVSQRVQALETELSVRLLNRTTRALSLTEAGEQYVVTCSEILTAIEQAEYALGETVDHPTGRLNITSMSLVAYRHILPNLDEFRAKFPNVHISIAISDRIEKLIEGGFDCAIRGGSMDDSTLVSSKVTDVEFGLYASRQWIGERPGLQGPGELTSHDIIKTFDHARGGSADWHLKNGARNYCVDTGASILADSDHVALEAAINGLGVVLTADFAAQPHVRAGNLERVFSEWSGGCRPIFLVYPSRAFLPTKLRVFLKWFRQVCL